MTITKLLTPLMLNNAALRPNRTMTPASVTIHNTGNKNAGASQHAKAQAAGNLKEIAVHYYVDDKAICQCLEDTWQGWHTGDGSNKQGGNYTSIGIEVCEHTGIDQRKAFENAARLTAELCEKHGFGIEKVRTHQSWSGKYCPHILLDGTGGMTWSWLLGLVRSSMTEAKPSPELDNTPADWASSAVAKAVARGIVAGDGTGNLRLHEPVTMERLLVVLDRCGVL